MYRLLAKQQNIPAEERIGQIILVSADTDMTPSLKAIKEDFPDIQMGIILPHREGIDRGVPGALQNYANWVRKHIKIDELKAHQFPDRVPTRKKPADKPHYW